MRGCSSDAGECLRETGWVQGSIAGKDTLEAIEQASYELGILISQDCDVVQGVDVEPTVELIFGTIRKGPRPDCQFGRNPRQLDLPLVTGERDLYASLRIHDRAQIRKERLASCSPSLSCRLDPSSITLLASWVSKRYTRPAWPDAFNGRLRTIEDRLDRLFKSEPSKPITGIFLILDPEKDELPPDQDYRTEIWLTVRAESRMNPAESRLANDFCARLRGIFKDCAGIVLCGNEVEVRSEADVTLDDLRYMRRFDRDYRSVALRPGGATPPPDL